MATRAYKHESQQFNPETGEILYESKYSVTAINNEEDYIKVYRYLNSVFAFKGINQTYIPCLMEISNYMSFADKGQQVILNGSNVIFSRFIRWICTIGTNNKPQSCS